MAGCSGGGSSQTAAPAPAQTSAAAAADTTAAAGGQEAPATEAAKDYKDMTGKVVIDLVAAVLPDKPVKLLTALQNLLLLSVIMVINHVLP